MPNGMTLGRPILSEGATLHLPVKTMSPQTSQAANAIASWDIYGGPKSGFKEEVYLFHLHGNKADQPKGSFPSQSTIACGESAFSFQPPNDSTSPKAKIRKPHAKRILFAMGGKILVGKRIHCGLTGKGLNLGFNLAQSFSICHRFKFP